MRDLSEFDGSWTAFESESYAQRAFGPIVIDVSLQLASQKQSPNKYMTPLLIML